MSEKAQHKDRIIIAHPSQEIRAKLWDIFANDYDILQAENGMQVIAMLKSQRNGISLLLMGLQLPEPDGRCVMEYMKRMRWLDELPVILISDGDGEAIARACDEGAMDYIEPPFDPATIRRRAANVIMLYARQRRLMDIVTDQMYQKEKSNKQMISILSHIVEYRNGESGLHVMHIGVITELLLKRLVKKTDHYGLKAADISRIAMASGLHDIGKIGIPEEILNKTDSLSEAEYQIMKTHAAVGAQMLDDLPFQQDSLLVKTAWEICRWHHERYDGGGYPDGLQGEEIPISAQVVAMADVYDALVSTRSYKAAYSHGRALRMILNGQCGAFNPLLLECLAECSDQLEHAMHGDRKFEMESREIRELASEAMNHCELQPSLQILRQLECERQKVRFFADALPDVSFAFQTNPPRLDISGNSAQRLGLNPDAKDSIRSVETMMRMDREVTKRIMRLAQQSTLEHPHFSVTGLFLMDGRERWCRCSCQALWTAEENPRFAGVVGRLIDLKEKCGSIEAAENAAYHEALMMCLRGDNAGDEQKLSGQQVWQLCQYLNLAFDGVRLVDAQNCCAYTVNQHGELVREDKPCHEIWKKDAACRDCISARAIARKGRTSKFEFAGEELYHIVALYLEVDGNPYALELISRVSDETLMNGKNALQETVDRHNSQVYADPVSGAYNKRYYEEQLRGLSGVEAVVLLDVDHFRRVNERYGHHMGDQVLRAVAQTVLANVRHSDSLVRSASDEFMLVFRTIPREVLLRKMETIRAQVEACAVEGYPDVRVTLSVCGEYGAGNTEDMVAAARCSMAEAKKTRNCIRLEDFPMDEK